MRKHGSMKRLNNNQSLSRTVLLLLAALLCLCLTGCGNSEMTLSQRIEAWENWKLPGLRDDEPAAPELPDAGTEGMTLAEMEAAAAEAEAAAQAEARAAAQLWARSTVLGEWSELSDSLPLFRPIVSWYGNLKLLEDGTCRERMRSDYAELREKLGGPGASDTVARTIFASIKEK